LETPDDKEKGTKATMGIRTHIGKWIVITHGTRGWLKDWLWSCDRTNAGH
jgi:hypothetical protein